MGSNVFANSREVSAKGDSNKSLGAMPDVCLSPPSPPAGPLPIPYPNFSEAGDTGDGSKSVLIGGKEAGLKDASNYKSSKGDEAATRSFGMGVVTHKIQGKTQHAAWSFDVQFEGENVIRHMDLTTHNHGSSPNNLAATVDVAQMAPAGPTKTDCKELSDKNKGKRKSFAQRQDLSANQKDTLTKGSSTITHAKFRAPGGKTLGFAAHNDKLAGKKDAAFVRGQSPGGLRTGKTAICQKAKDRGFKYKKNLKDQHGGHSEARLIETVLKGTSGSGPKGTLVMSIDWKSGKKRMQTPCDNCKRVICAAMACGLEIVLCQGKPPKPRKQDPDKCPKSLAPS